METLFRCCTGLDVRKSTIEVQVRRIEEDGQLWQQTRQRGTMTGEVRAMAQWLAGLGVTHVAMESTGVFWKPIYNILEGQFALLLVNARHIKQVPERKTDVKDCQWIAQLLQHGLLRGSFVPARPQRERLSEVPAIQKRAAEVLHAEIGGEVKPYPSARHLSSRAGMCPGNDESAGQRRCGRTSPGNRWLRQALVQAAWAASHAKGSYLAAQYRRWAGRRGKKRALVAVGHSILAIVYALLKEPSRYNELGADILHKREQERLTRYFVKRLEGLGHQVTLQPRMAA
jgi:transposase